MNWIALILQLLTVLGADEVDANRLSDLLGKPVEKDDKRWRIEPNQIYREALTDVVFQVENLRIGRLITTVELRLAKPWRTYPATIAQALGSSPIEMPLPPATILPGGDDPPPPKTLVYDIDRDEKSTAVVVTGRQVGQDPAGEIDIIEIRVRRFYD